MRFGLFRRSSAPVARERLQILLEFERRIDGSDLLGRLRDEIIAVIAKHVTLDPENVRVRIDRGKRRNGQHQGKRSAAHSRQGVGPPSRCQCAQAAHFDGGEANVLLDIVTQAITKRAACA